MSLKIIFAGTPEFAVPSLKTLINSEHQVVAVYTQPDRPAGRGQHLQASPIKAMAQSHNISIFQPNTLRDSMIQNDMRALNADIIVVVAYGFILPEAVLNITRLGCVNVHPSLLPRWRGAAPIARCIESGDNETGVTIMQLDKGMDTGPILKQEKYNFLGDETSKKCHDIFSQRGAALLLTALNELEKNIAHPIAQNNTLATLAVKIQKSEAIIDWTLSAEKINNKIRAFNAWPVAHTTFLNAPLRIFQANVLREKTTEIPGTLIRKNKKTFCIATGDGMLEMIMVQLPGKKMITAADFMHGYSDELMPGKTRFSC